MGRKKEAAKAQKPNIEVANDASPPESGERQVNERPLESIRADPFQPRQHFDVEGIRATLKDDKRIREPIRIRPTRADEKNKDGSIATEPWTIINGETRWRAAKLEGMPTIPCLPPENLDEVTIRCEQLLSSSTNTPLRPLEQADTMAELSTKHKLSAEEIATRTGIGSTRAVYRAIALSRLCPEVRAELEAGTILHTVGIAIASLSDAKAQAKCCKEILESESGHDLRFAKAHITSRYHLQLVPAQCGFDPSDKTLPGGPCSKCPKSTAAQRSLGIIEDTSTEARCTDKTCFEGKRAASWERRKQAALRAGIKVVEGDEALKLFPTSYSIVPKPPTLANIDEPIFFKDEHTTYRKLLGDAAKPSLIAYAHGKVHECMTRKEIAAALRKAGHEDAAKGEEEWIADSDSDDASDDDASKGSRSKLPTRPDNSAWARAREEERRKRGELLVRMLERVNPVDENGAPSMPFWRFLASLTVRMQDDYVASLEDVLERRGLAKSDGTTDATDLDTI
ncbi:MAG: ParB N-terminal domain-containing protein [Polyangiaceae bacterium]|nr:ParB N-terminal domain-containing protein [Polyangiaceae bacterium]